jgi:hypothetical protein
VTQLTSYFNPSPTADPRTRGSVRRASGFVQIPITLIFSLPGPHSASNSGEHILRNRGQRIALERLQYPVVAWVECPLLCANNTARKTNPTKLGWRQRQGDVRDSTA